jgi:hypothetical protein
VSEETYADKRHREMVELNEIARRAEGARGERPMIRAWRRYRDRKRRQRQEQVLGALALAAPTRLARADRVAADALDRALALAGLERSGEVTSRWAVSDPYPRRRLYRLADKEV